jgi:hypothetical protein
MRRLIAVAIAAAMLSACGSSAGPTPQIIYVTPARSASVTPSLAPTRAETSAPTATNEAPAQGWTLYTGSSPVGWSVQLPVGWDPEPAGDFMFASTGPANAGTAEIFLDDRPVARGDFKSYIEDEKAALSEPILTGSIVHVTVDQASLPGGVATILTTRDDGGGLIPHSVSVSYHFQTSSGAGVIILYFRTAADTSDLTTVPDVPTIWAEIAATFNPEGSTIP